MARTVGNMYVSVQLDAATMRRQEAAREERRAAHAALPKRRLRAAQGPAAARTVCVSGPLVPDRLCQLTVDQTLSGVRSCGAPVVRASAMIVRCFRTRHQRGPVPPFVVRVAFRAVKVNLTSLHSQSAQTVSAKRQQVPAEAERTTRAIGSHIVGREQEQCLLPHPRLGLHGTRYVPQSLILQRKGFRFEHGFVFFCHLPSS
eukprot:COSAG04_NODE_649_length_11584_cov_241.553069_8_plen_202_part_00